MKLYTYVTSFSYMVECQKEKWKVACGKAGREPECYVDTECSGTFLWGVQYFKKCPSSEVWGRGNIWHLTSFASVEFSLNAKVNKVGFNRLLDHTGIYAHSHLPINSAKRGNTIYIFLTCQMAIILHLHFSFAYIYKTPGWLIFPGVQKEIKKEVEICVFAN